MKEIILYAREGWGGIIPRVKELGGLKPDEIGM